MVRSFNGQLECFLLVDTMYLPVKIEFSLHLHSVQSHFYFDFIKIKIKIEIITHHL